MEEEKVKQAEVVEDTLEDAAGSLVLREDTLPSSSSYTVFRDIVLEGKDDETLAQYMKSAQSGVCRCTLFVNWFLGRVASYRCKDGTEEATEESITKALKALAKEMSVGFRKIQYMRQLYQLFQDFDLLETFGNAGLTWTNCCEIIFPLPPHLRDQMLEYLGEKIEENGQVPSPSEMKEKVMILKKQDLQQQSETGQTEEGGEGEGPSSAEEKHILESLKTMKEFTGKISAFSKKLEKDSLEYKNLIQDMSATDLGDFSENFSEVLGEYISQMGRGMTALGDILVDAVAESGRNRDFLAETMTDLLIRFGRGGVYPAISQEGNQKTVEFATRENSSPDQKD